MQRAIVCAGTVLLCLAGCGGSETGGTLNNSGIPATTPLAGAGASPVANNVTPSNAGTPAVTPPTAPSMPGTSGQAVPPAQGAAMTVPPAQGAAMTTPPPQTAPVMPMMPAVQVPQGIAPPEGFKPNEMGTCNLHTKWKGDEFCILPPPPDKGFQLHIGPSNYDNPEAMYLLQPGQENVRTYQNTAGNDKQIYFYVRQYRMRPGAHHTIVRDASTGRRLSGSDVNQDHPVGGITAPENGDIGIPLTAHAPITTDHHAINTTEQTLLQEVWVNFWYVDPAKVKEATTLLYDPGSVTNTIAPHQDVVLGPWECDIMQPGRLISMFGHVHANDVRFSAWRTRAGKSDLIYESYHWEEPLWVEYTSLAQNTPPDPAKMLSGASTGIVDLKPGDTLKWECREVNKQETTLRFTNQTYEGWMCIIIGDLVGTKCQSRMPGIAIDPSIE